MPWCGEKTGLVAGVINENKSDIKFKDTLVINLIFDTGKFPNNLKNSLVVPIHQSGEKKDKNNYRPITITSSNEVGTKMD